MIKINDFWSHVVIKRNPMSTQPPWIQVGSCIRFHRLINICSLMYISHYDIALRWNQGNQTEIIRCKSLAICSYNEVTSPDKIILDLAPLSQRGDTALKIAHGLWSLTLCIYTTTHTQFHGHSLSSLCVILLTNKPTLHTQTMITLHRQVCR